MKRLILFSCLLITSCAHVSLGKLAATNQANLVKLSIGMSKQDVMIAMGTQTAKTGDGIVNNPWTIEMFVREDGTQYEALYYIIRKNPPFTPVGKKLTTSVVLKNGKVVSWGENALDKYR